MPDKDLSDQIGNLSELDQQILRDFLRNQKRQENPRSDDDPDATESPNSNTKPET